MRPAIASVSFSLASSLYEKVNEHSQKYPLSVRLGGSLVVVLDLVNDPLAFIAATILYLGSAVLNVLGCLIRHSKCSLEDAVISLEYSVSCLGKGTATTLLSPLKFIIQLATVWINPKKVSPWESDFIPKRQLNKKEPESVFDRILNDYDSLARGQNRFENLHNLYKTNPYKARLWGAAIAIYDLVLEMLNDLRLIAKISEMLVDFSFVLPVKICLFPVKGVIQLAKVLWDPSTTNYWGKAKDEPMKKVASASRFPSIDDLETEDEFPEELDEEADEELDEEVDSEPSFPLHRESPIAEDLTEEDFSSQRPEEADPPPSPTKVTFTLLRQSKGQSQSESQAGDLPRRPRSLNLSNLKVEDSPSLDDPSREGTVLHQLRKVNN